MIINQVNHPQNQITFLQNQISQLNKNIQELNNNKINKEIINEKGRYAGQVVNGMKEGKGIMHFNKGDIYDGELKNDKHNGKGIYYCNKEPCKGDRYEGD